MTADQLVAAVMPMMAPPPELTVSEWAEERRRLPASSAARGARWRNDTAPYLREIQDAANDSSVRRLAVMGAAQSGKSESLMNMLGFWMENDPSTVLVLKPSFEDAKRLSRGPLADMIRTTPTLSAIVRRRRASRAGHDAESTLLEKQYPGGSLILAGAGTPNSYAGVAARRAVADEFERFPILDEGAPDILLANRTTSFYDGLVVFISTPLLVDGLIDAQFKLTDQRRYHLTCPTCGHVTWTAWRDEARFHVVFTDRDAETARLACPHCGAKHSEVVRRQMVAAGVWKPTAAPVDATARGYHVPAMISTLGDVTLSRLAQKWLAARASGPASLRVFINTTLAEPWEDRGARIQPHALASRLEDHGAVEVPAPVVCLTAGVDVQLNRFEVQVLGWAPGSESWVIDAHVVPGDPSQPEVQVALLAALDEQYRHASGVVLPILATAVDSGFLPEKVAYALAARRPRRVFAVKGVGGRLSEPSILKYDPRTPPALINVDGLKLEVALGLEMATSGPGFMHLNRRCCDEDYLSQLCAEHRETRRKNGVATMVWVEDRAENHALDTATYARAALKLLARQSGSRSEQSMLMKLAERMSR